MQEKAPAPEISTVAESAWAEAHRRLLVIRSLAENPQRTRADVESAASKIGCSVVRTYGLLAQYVKEPTAASLLPHRRGPKAGMSRLAPAVDAAIDQAIESVYLTRQRPRLSDLLVEVRRRCRELELPAPGRKAVSTRIAIRPASTLLGRRHGRRAARERLAPVLGSLISPAPLALVQIDHTLVDVIVVDSVTRLPIQRPWLTLAIDVYSRCVAGFHLSLEPPSATSVALCIAQAALPKEAWLAQQGIEAVWPVSGIMRTLHLDNAKEFHSEALRRGCEQYGIALEYRPRRTPHYGGHIERLIGTLMGKVHLLPGTTFSNIEAKGDDNPEKTASMTLDEVQRWLGHAIAGIYHRNVQRAIHTTPVAAWETGVSQGAAIRSVNDPRRFLIDFLPIERRRVRREGIQLHSIAYWSDVLTTWIGDPNRMIVRYDPRDLSRVYLLAPDGEYYDLAYRDVRRPSIGLWEHRRAMKRLREEGHAQVDEGAIFRAVDRMREISEGASIATKGARRERERRRRTNPIEVPEHLPVDSVADGGPAGALFPVEDWS